MIGIDDEKFIRGKIPMTKREIRILTLANADIGSDNVVVDIGAGTGSISIEAAKIAVNGHVYAIEKNPEGVNLIKKNADKFSVQNITVINAEAPDGLQNIPKIDVAIIGGNGGLLDEILNTIDGKIKIGGRIVLNFITIQSLASALNWFKSHTDYKYETVQVQINRLQNLGFYDIAKALNPIYIMTAIKIKKSQMDNVINISDAKTRITTSISLRCIVKD